MLRRLLACFVVALSSCASVSHPPLTLHVESKKNINHRGVSHALPVALKLYQLEDKQAFQSLSFEELCEESEVLKSLQSKIITLTPNEKREFNWPLHQRAQYLAVVAFFRKPKATNWRAIYPIPSALIRQMYAVTIAIDNEEVTIR